MVEQEIYCRPAISEAESEESVGNLMEEVMLELDAKDRESTDGPRREARIKYVLGLVKENW